jgi:hypothetical protein
MVIVAESATKHPTVVTEAIGEDCPNDSESRIPCVLTVKRRVW